MPMTKRQYILIGVVVYTLALLMTLPANLFVQQINGLHPQLQVHGVEGSLWHGRVEQLSVNHSSVRNIEWRFQPQALLLGRLQLFLSYADNENRIHFSVAKSIDGSLQIRDLDGQLDAAFVQSLTPYSVPALHGMLLFEDVGSSLDGRYPQRAVGQLEWREAAVDLGQNIPLGNMVLLMEQDTKGIKAVLSEKSGLLDGEARLLLEGDGNYTLQARFTPTARAAYLQRHLALILRKASDGSYQRSLKGKLP